MVSMTLRIFWLLRKQVDELGHFEIVHLDRRFTLRRDHQVRLDGSIQSHVPRGDSIDAASRQICSFEVSADQSRPAEVRPAEVRPAEVRPAEVRPAEVRPAEVRRSKVREEEERTNEVRHAAEVRPVEVSEAEVCPAEVRPAEVRGAEVRPADERPVKVRPAEVRQMEIWADVTIFFPPLIPRPDSFHKLREMFRIRQVACLSRMFWQPS